MRSSEGSFGGKAGAKALSQVFSYPNCHVVCMPHPSSPCYRDIHYNLSYNPIIQRKTQLSVGFKSPIFSSDHQLAALPSYYIYVHPLTLNIRITCCMTTPSIWEEWSCNGLCTYIHLYIRYHSTNLLR